MGSNPTPRTNLLVLPVLVVPSSRPSPDRAKRAPGPQGREQLRALRTLSADLYGTLDRLHGEHGPIFRIGRARAQVLWVASPSAAADLLGRKRPDLTMGKAYTFLEPVGGEGALIAADRPAHGQRRRPLQPSFQATQVRQWSERLDHHVGPWLEAKVRGGESFPFLASLRPVLLDVVVDLMLGRSALAGDPVWKEQLLGMMAYSTRPLGQQWLKVPLPGTAWARFRVAREEVDRRLEEAVRERVATGAPPAGQAGDLLDVILGMAEAGAYETSGREPLRAIRDEIMGLVSAGFETTSSAAAWTVAFAESENGTGTAFRQRLADLSPDALQDDPLVDAFLQETLRLRPPAPVLLRRARETTAVDGFHVPRGSRIALATWLLHRDPSLHPQPHRFAPERFRDGKPDRWAYLPFGYGARHCIGGAMARTLLKRTAWWVYGRHDTVEAHNLTLQPVGMALRPARDPCLRLRPR